MPKGSFVYITDSSGNVATITGSGALTVQLDSGITVAVNISGATIAVSGNNIYSVGMSGKPYYQDTSGRIFVESHVNSGNIIVASITQAPNVYVVDRASNQAVSVNQLSSSPDINNSYGVVSQGVMYVKEGYPGDGSIQMGLVYTAMSGQGSIKVGTSGMNTITITSGLYVIAPPTNVGRSRPVIVCDDLSGGTILQSGDCEGLIVKNFSTSSGDVYIGYSNERPYSGYGYALQPSESLTLDINNFNKVAVCGTISGYCKITYTGLAFV